MGQQMTNHRTEYNFQKEEYRRYFGKISVLMGPGNFDSAHLLFYTCNIILSHPIIQPLTFTSNAKLMRMMPKPKRHLQATAEETSTPPNSLKEGEVLAQVIKGEGKNLYVVELPESKKLLVELPSRFRSTIWMKRGSVVLVNTMAFEDRENKLGGEIINIVRDEKIWRKQSYWYISSRTAFEKCKRS